MQAPVRAEAELIGSKATMKVLNPIAPQFGHVIAIGERQVVVSKEPTYNFQLRAFVSSVRGEQDCPTDARDGLAQMALLDAVRRRARPAGTD